MLRRLSIYACSFLIIFSAAIVQAKNKQSEAPAVIAAKRVVQTELKSKNKSSVRLAVAYLNLSKAYSSVQKLDEAKETLSQGLKVFEEERKITQTLTKEQWAIDSDLNTEMGNLLLAQGENESAVFYLERAVEDANLVIVEPNVPDYAQLLLSQAWAYCHTQRTAEAESILQKALKIFVKLEGEKGVSVADTYRRFGCVYNHNEKFKKAIEVYQKAISILDQRLSLAQEIVWDNYVVTYVDLVNTYKLMKKEKEAKLTAKKALEILDKNSQQSNAFYNLLSAEVENL